MNRVSQKNIQTQTLKFGQHSVEIERRAFRRKVSLIIKADQRIVVKSGLTVSDQFILKFLNEKKNWIEKSLQKMSMQVRQLQEKFPLKKLKQGEIFPFLGNDLNLRFVPTPLRKPFFSRHENYLNLHLPMSVWAQGANQVLTSEADLQVYLLELQKFYLIEAEKLIPERIKIWAEKMQLYPSKITLRNQKSRWGSCSSRGSISINWRLMAAPLEILDYVLVHELSHLQYMNHSKKFWDLVEAHYPLYLKSEKWLRENHQLLHFLMNK